MGGRIQIHSRGQGYGTSVSVFIPVCKENPAKAKVMEDSPLVEVNEMLPQQKRILLVDDTMVNQMLMKRMLEFLGGIVVCASSGEEAIARCQDSGPFDVVFMDLCMPGMGGLMATREMRDRGLMAADCPIIILTGLPSESVEKECMEAGANRVLCKPVERRTFVESLNRV